MPEREKKSAQIPKVTLITGLAITVKFADTYFPAFAVIESFGRPYRSLVHGIALPAGVESASEISAPYRSHFSMRCRSRS